MLLFFEEERPEDDRPQRVVEAGLAWARGEIKVGKARAAAIAAHASARETARAAARAAAYAARAVAHARSPAAPDTAVAEEWDRHYRRLPEHLRTVAFSAR